MSDDFRNSFGFDLDELNSFTGGFLATLGRLQEDMAETVGRGEAADGHVTVAFSELNGVHGLVIGPRAMRLGAPQLADAVTAAVEAARADLRRQIGELVSESLGDMSAYEETVTALTGSAEEALDRALRNTADLTDRLR